MKWYEDNWKKLFLIPIVLLIISVFLITNTIIDTGTFVNKGVTLKGGVSITAQYPDTVSIGQVSTSVEQQFPQADIEVRTISAETGLTQYVVNAADISDNEREAADLLSDYLQSNFQASQLTVETTGPSLGDAFFTQTILAILLAFLWMGWVVYLYFGDSIRLKIGMAAANLGLSSFVLTGLLAGTFGLTVMGILVLLAMFIYFRSSVPSGAVILAAISTILFTLAAIDLLGVRLSTAGVAAFLMLIGYSVDTDILLSTRVLKEREGTLIDRMKSAAKTGLTMQVTTTAAVGSALLLSNSEVIRQIMLILLIGMIGDVIFTWLQNAGILYWHEKKQIAANSRGKKSTKSRKKRSRKGGKK